MSEPLLRMNDKWPAGWPSTILFHSCTHVQVRCFLIVYIGQLEIVVCCQAFHKPGCLESVWRASWPCEGYPSATHLGKSQIPQRCPFVSGRKLGLADGLCLGCLGQLTS